MEKHLFIICSILLLVVCGCSTRLTDSEKLALVMEKYNPERNLSEVNDYRTFDVKGPVRKIKYRQDSLHLYNPITEVRFETDGRLKECFAEGDDLWMNKAERGKDESLKMIELGSYTSAYQIYVTYFCGKDRRVDSLYVQDTLEGDGDVYLYKYSDSGSLNGLCQISYVFNTYKDDFDETTVEYAVFTDSVDSHGNWIRRTFKSADGEIKKEERNIEYYEPRVLPIKSDSLVYCVIEPKFEEKEIMIYNQNTERWTRFLAFGEDVPYYRLKDARAVGDNIFCIFFTGACGGPGHDCDVMRYSIPTGKWQSVIWCHEDSEFVGDSIKAHIFDITKFGDCNMHNEYSDYIKWIDMRKVVE